MKYNKETADKILKLTNECLDDPEISSDEKLNSLLGELNQKVKYQKRFKNSTGLRKQVGEYVRKHGFQMPQKLSDLLEALSEANANSGSKRNWLSGFQN
ncbi:hypothetical protein [Companilactobacillus mishanensis]|uniref:hypothetical protein n=1 Tax=Companilactobacillus mishanensis TaxID=2486008 RepID=UPI0012955E83|nr:hypothetical protein [Companilactobacillus mishanensis]MQS89322.1 hypothetical protein [Companilactobacillus mishanensis]